MSITDNKYIIVGEFGAPFGVRGEIKVNSATDPFDALIDYHPWYIESFGKWVEIEITHAKPQGSGLVVCVKDFADRDEVRTLTGRPIAITRDQLPELDQAAYYWADLEGFEVINEQQILLGTIDHLFNAGANDIMVITGDKRRMIPFIHDQYILNVDMEKKRILVNWDADF